ncbi:YidC/Oxa1 family membrane protein insertase [Candidatus Haliotispira prima]|uniref:YidC/Oxa1 family membrane protein insertase n=1 Tax=Candidatus Haliotispira prima TaxID=3034016 RepID=A0ABY8MJ09_9SPIO|nr:YidC/Oxa1 family membrane protein insertase [Candidatus Haliotispira prima]
MPHSTWYNWPIVALEYVMQFLLQWAYSLTASYGLSIILLSLVVNICLLPAYHFAELWQNRERRLQHRFRPKLDEFSRAFAGATLHAVTRTYYRQQNYHPVLALRSGLGLLLQLPFFLAAYRLLSHYTAFSGRSFAFLHDLNQPDQLLPLLGEHLNLLPFVMTALNLWAAAVYGRRLPVAERKQVYLLSLLFFVLLYNSPCSLLLYWTCNNIFSLLKNMLQVYSPLDRTPSFTAPGSFIAPIRHWFRSCRKLFDRLKKQFLSVLVWAIRLLQLAGLLLFFERMIFFKEVDSSIPAAVLALYLAAGYVLGVHLLQLAINVWRGRSLPPLRSLPSLRSANRPFRVYRALVMSVSVLLPLVVLTLMLFSLRGHTYFSNAMIDRLGLLALALAALAASVSLEFCTESGRASRSGQGHRSSFPQPLSQPSLQPLQTWAHVLSQGKHRDLSWPLFCNILCFNLLIFVGVPLAFAASSPSEFPRIFRDMSSGLLPGFALGTLGLGLLAVLFRLKHLGNPALYRLMQLLSFSLLWLAFINVFFRSGAYGTLSDFVWDQPDRFRITALQRLSDVVLVPGLAALSIILWRRGKLALLRLSSVVLLAGTLLFSGYHYVLLQNSLSGQSPSELSDVVETQQELEPLLHLSRSGHNVIVLMMDRFIGGFMPDLLRSYPELADPFRDFTWYANTVSLGPTTLVSLPSILGGYDYSIFAINQRLEDGLTPNLAEEVNRAYKVLPTIFRQQGYHAAVYNPQYANFAARGDLSIFDGTGIEARELGADYSSRWFRQEGISFEDLGGRTSYMLAMLGLFRTAIPSLRPSIYDESVWLGANSSAEGKYRTLINDWSALYYLPEQMDAPDDNQKPLYFFFNNLVSHQPNFVDRNLEPAREPDLGPPVAEMTEDERQRFKSLLGTRHFYAGGASLKLIVRLLERLRELEVYDNTTVVVLSDHSYDIHDPTMGDSYPEMQGMGFNPGYLHPLLLVKSAGQRQDQMLQDWESFMSVADLSAVLQRELGFEMRDPFTGKDIGWERSRKEKAEGLTTAVDTPWNISNINVRVTVPHALMVRDDIFTASNWSRLW